MAKKKAATKKTTRKKAAKKKASKATGKKAVKKKSPKKKATKKAPGKKAAKKKTTGKKKTSKKATPKKAVKKTSGSSAALTADQQKKIRKLLKSKTAANVTLALISFGAVSASTGSTRCVTPMGKNTIDGLSMSNSRCPLRRMRTLPDSSKCS